MSQPAHERCETCRYWDPLAPETESEAADARQFTQRLAIHGLCRRFPPQVYPGNPGGDHPLTGYRFWCGEWAPERSTPTEVPA